MTVEQTIEAQHQARMSLVQCAAYIRNRNMLIWSAAQVGIPKTEIARIMGLNRGHIHEIIKRESECHRL